MIGEMEIAFVTAASARDSLTLQLVEATETADIVRLGLTLKQIAVDNAIATVERAVAIAGGGAYFRKSPLERLARDVRAARFHPPSAPISFQMAGERFREAWAAAQPAKTGI
jgi:acyl-CoA dehydrogenase